MLALLVLTFQVTWRKPICKREEIRATQREEMRERKKQEISAMWSLILSIFSHTGFSSYGINEFPSFWTTLVSFSALASQV